MVNKKYWQDRAETRLITSEQLGNVAVEKTLAIYDRALKNIDEQVTQIYNSYSKNGVLSVSELKRALNPSNVRDFLKNIEATTKKLGLDPSKVYDQRYLSRMNRLQALMEQIKLEVMAIAPQEEMISTKAYEQILRGNYESFQKDIRDKLKLPPTFATLDTDAVNTILHSNFYGKKYSDRIWTNTEKLALELPSLLGAKMATGMSVYKASQVLRERFGVSAYNATRLIRTESNFFQSQAELQSYVDDGIEEYEYYAVMDDRTSKICRKLDNKIFKVSEAIAGINYPPMHGNCRSTTVASWSNKPRVEITKEMRDKMITDPDDPRRFARFLGGNTTEDDVKARWRAAMQKQMTPDKATHDYNADMNILTQSLSKKLITQDEFKSKLDILMGSIPQDYPLRAALENIAELNGWERPVVFNPVDLTEAQFKVIADKNRVGITEPEDQAIYEFQSRYYKPMNEYLRKGIEAVDFPKFYAEEQAKTLDGAIAKSTIPDNYIAYRGAGHLATKLGDLKIGDVFQDNGYSSTSLNFNLSKQFTSDNTIFKIQLPKGAKGLMPSSYTGIGQYEQEILLPRGQRFKVMNIETGFNPTDKKDKTEYKMVTLSLDSTKPLPKSVSYGTANNNMIELNESYQADLKAMPFGKIELSDLGKYIKDDNVMKILEERNVTFTKEKKIEAGLSGDANGQYQGGRIKIKDGTTIETLHHEIGHAIDQIMGDKVFPKVYPNATTAQLGRTKLSDFDSSAKFPMRKEWKPIIMNRLNRGGGVEVMKLEAKPSETGDGRPSFRRYKVKVILDDKNFGEHYAMYTPKFRRYLRSESELFADAYAQYRSDSKKFKEYAPRMYLFFKDLFNGG